jgi:hypothetical protein
MRVPAQPQHDHLLRPVHPIVILDELCEGDLGTL